MRKNEISRKLRHLTANLPSIISFFAGLGSVIAFTGFVTIYFNLLHYPDMGENGIGNGFLGIFFIFWGWILSIIGLITGSWGKASDTKRIAVIGLILSSFGFIFNALFFLIGILQ